MQTITSVAPWAAAVQIINIVLIVGIPLALLCLLQWWLSRRQSPVPGLILPVLHVILSVIMLFSFTAYTAYDIISVSTVTTYDGGAVVVEDAAGNTLALEEIPAETPAEDNDLPPTPPPQPDESAEDTADDADAQVTPPPQEAESAVPDDPTAVYANTESTIPTVIGLFLLFNIPTYVYVIIYVIERRKLRRSRTVNKTLIQDL